MAERVSASASVKNVYGDHVVVGNRTVIPSPKFGMPSAAVSATRTIRRAAVTAPLDRPARSK